MHVTKTAGAPESMLAGNRHRSRWFETVVRWEQHPAVSHPHDTPIDALDTLLRERFRNLVGEYDTIVHSGMIQRASMRAEQLRRELDYLADVIGVIEAESS